MGLYNSVIRQTAITAAVASCSTDNQSNGVYFAARTGTPFTDADDVKSGSADYRELLPADALSYSLTGLSEDTTYYVGWSQEDDLFVDQFDTDTDGWTFARTGDQTFVDHEGLLKIATTDNAAHVAALAVENLAAQLTTDTITVVSGRDYAVTIAGDSGATAALSGAAVQTLTADGTNRISHNNGTAITAATTSLVVTVTGTLTELLVEDVTGQANQNCSDYVAVGTTEYFSNTNPNDVSGTGVVTRTASNTPLESMLGVSLEDARSNACDDPTDVAQWTSNIRVAITGTTVSPLGTLAKGVVPDGTNTSHWVSDTGSVTLSEPYTQSYIVAANGYDWVQITGNSGFATSSVNFHLSGAGTVGSVVGVVAGYGIEALGLGFYRIFLTLVADETTGVGSYMFAVIAGDIASRLPAFSGDTTSGVYMAHGQLEEGAFPSSPILGASRAATEMSRTFADIGTANPTNDMEVTLTVTMGFDSTYVASDILIATVGDVTDGVQLAVNQDTFTATKYVDGSPFAATVDSSYAKGDTKIITFSMSSTVGVLIDVDSEEGTNADTSSILTAATAIELEPSFCVVKKKIFVSL